MKYKCPKCGTICNFKSSSVVKRCGICGNIIGNVIKNPNFQPIKRKSIFEKNIEDVPFFKFIGTYIITPLLLLLFIGGCITSCIIMDKEDDKRRKEKQYENASMIATHITVYHPYITKIDLGRIRVSSWSGKIDCDYCDRLNKIKGNY